MDSYIECTLCGHKQSLRWANLYNTNTDIGHMQDHYQLKHPETVLIRIVKGDPAVAYSNYPEYREIPSGVYPKVFDGGTEFEWADLREMARPYR